MFFQLAAKILHCTPVARGEGDRSLPSIGSNQLAVLLTRRVAPPLADVIAHESLDLLIPAVSDAFHCFAPFAVGIANIRLGEHDVLG